MDFAGVAVMVVGAVVSIPMAMRGYRPRRPNSGTDNKSVYRSYRQLLGRSILLGLELLVAADIIRTVAITPTFESVGVLGIIVLIRTFLSFSLELEITGKWPWQKEDLSEDGAPGRRQKPESAAVYRDGIRASPESLGDRPANDTAKDQVVVTGNPLPGAPVVERTSNEDGPANRGRPLKHGNHVRR